MDIKIRLLRKLSPKHDGYEDVSKADTPHILISQRVNDLTEEPEVCLP
jgi:hypothetical protein